MAINALQSSASALSALGMRLDVISNNLANANTDGFKASRVNFQDLLYVEKAQPGVENANGDQRPTGIYVGLGVKPSGTQMSFEQGAPVTTGRPLDIMIDGKGFFKVGVQTDLAEGGIAYTRAGNLSVNRDGELVLASDQGRRLDPVITIPPDAGSITIMETGEIFVTTPGQAATQQVGQLEIANFINPAGLKQLGENLLAETDGSGPPITGNPAEQNFGRIKQGLLEGSNVNPTFELINLIRTQRTFEMSSQTIRAADQAMQTISRLGQ